MRRIFFSCSRIAASTATALLLVSNTSLPAQSRVPAAGATPTFSQRLTLAEAQERARQVSPVLTASREALAAATGNERQARAIPNPILSYQREQTSGRGQDNSQSIASVDQPLDLAGRNARLAAAARRREAAEARLLDAAARLDLDVARVYAHVIASARRAELANDAAAAFARARRVSDERLQAGDISGYASRRVRLEAARYAALGAEANLSLRGARLALAGLLANDAADIMETDFELEAPAPSLVPIP